MKNTTIRGVLYLKYFLKRLENPLKESEFIILIAINELRVRGEYCSASCLFRYLTGIKKTPNRKKFFELLKRLCNDGYVTKCRYNYILKIKGELILNEMETRIKGAILGEKTTIRKRQNTKIAAAAAF